VDGRVAQLVEQCPFKAWVAGSSPAALTSFQFTYGGWQQVPFHSYSTTLQKMPLRRLLRCGSLLHIRMTFAFTTPRRFYRLTGE
jgi:hypothetical protein